MQSKPLKHRGTHAFQKSCDLKYVKTINFQEVISKEIKNIIFLIEK